MHNCYWLVVGGYRWQAESRPLVTDIPARSPAVHYRPIELREPMRIHRDAVLAALGHERMNILEARSPEDHSGKRVGGPGSRDIDVLR